MKNSRNAGIKLRLLPLLLTLLLLLNACSLTSARASADTAAAFTEILLPDNSISDAAEESETDAEEIITLENIPAWADSPYVELNGNVPDFTETDLTTTSFETYSELDALGRCGTAYACIGTDLMPVEERESIGQVKPTGWHTVTYDIVDGRYLYNRCHLIGYQLSGENANEKNLITGTRYMNVDGMLPFENMVADYVKETGNHVLYRVTPVFEDDNLVASGVQIEALSVEDQGESIEFNVYVYNIQPGIDIDYATGESWLSEAEESTASESGETGTASASDVNTDTAASETGTWVLNTSSKKFHDPACSGVAKMSESNRQDYTGSRDALIAMGYDPCGICNP